MPLPPPPPQSEHSRAVFRNNLHGEDAYSRHQRFVQSAQLYNATLRDTTVKKTEFDVLKNTHRFLREDEDGDGSWEDSLALKYYEGLFKEFAICDLKHYKSGNFALRWRTEDEVVSGAGQFTCGNTRCKYHDPARLDSRAGRTSSRNSNMPTLYTLELPFGYTEMGQDKLALVKVVLCERCQKKLLWKRTQDKTAAKGSQPEAMQAPSEEQKNPSKSTAAGDAKSGTLQGTTEAHRDDRQEQATSLDTSKKRRRDEGSEERAEGYPESSANVRDPAKSSRPRTHK